MSKLFIDRDLLLRCRNHLEKYAPHLDTLRELNEVISGTRDFDGDRFARDLAVLLVDVSHNYTMEFAPSPAAHREEYEQAEFCIRGELERELKMQPQEWKRVEENGQPIWAGIYRVRYPGDSESIDGHTIYEYGDYSGWAEWIPADEAEIAEDPNFKGHWNTEHDEESDSIFAYFGPFTVPPEPVL